MRLPAFPLLAKELIEIAARRRTYTTRVVYAILLIGFFLVVNASALKNVMANPLSALGSGQWMFVSLVYLQVAGICLFLPAFAAGLITQEKERDSLVLLLLTDLSPWQILLQKYVSGLILIGSFLLIGLPLAGFCYAYGGLSTANLFNGVAMLVLTSLQVAAFALMCSARARTTVGAFVGTYVGAGLFVGAVSLAGWAFGFVAEGVETDEYVEEFLKVFAPVALNQTDASIEGTLIQCIAPVVATIFFLVAARIFFTGHAFSPRRHRLLGLFRRVDGWAHRMNRMVGGVTFRGGVRELPGDDPVAWRELARTVIGRPQYLFRLLIPAEVVTVGLCLWAITVEPGSMNNELFSVFGAIGGTVAVLVLSAFAANAFVSERVNQTLEVLLTTPLSAREIVRQKARMLTRFMWVLALPLATVFAIEAWAESDEFVWSPRIEVRSAMFPYLLWAVLSLAIYLPLVLWLSLWIGLKMRTRFRAILTALGVIVGWCVLPFFLGEIFESLTSQDYDLPVFFLSPITIPAMNEVRELKRYLQEWAVIVPAVTYLGGAVLTLVFRHRCLSRADHYLRR